MLYQKILSPLARGKRRSSKVRAVCMSRSGATNPASRSNRANPTPQPRPQPTPIRTPSVAPHYMPPPGGGFAPRGPPPANYGQPPSQIQYTQNPAHMHPGGGNSVAQYGGGQYGGVGAPPQMGNRIQVTPNNVNQLFGEATLRITALESSLSRIEQRLEMLEQAEHERGIDVPMDAGAATVDRALLDSLVSRIKALEAASNTAPLTPATSVQALSETVTKLRVDVDQTKNSVLKLSDFTMDLDMRMRNQAQVAANAPVYSTADYDFPATGGGATALD